MDIRKSVPTNYGNWATTFGPAWTLQAEKLRSRFGGKIQSIDMPGDKAMDVATVRVSLDAWVEVIRFLKTDPECDYGFLADITATDELPRSPRFDLICHLFSLRTKSRIRIKTGVSEGQDAPSLTRVWAGANWAEREVFDMFGIRFSSHPDLRRILLDQRWKGHPLRKDYDIRGYQIFSDPEVPDPGLLEGRPEKELNSDNVFVDADPDDLWEDSRVIINIGPTHPAMHGALRTVAKCNGETIEKCYSMFGYTHRAKEKLGEHRTYHQFIVYTDRLNYCSALINNMAYAMAVERLMGVDVPDRAIWIRMICCEIARVIDHIVCVGIAAVDLGAFTFFLYGFHQREEAYTLIEKLCGARLTTSYCRIGGLAFDAPDGFEKELKAWIKRTRDVLAEMDKLLTTNKIWCRRTIGVGIFNQEECREYSYSGPNARAAGIDIDLRRDQPSMFYKDVEFDIPIRQNGDCYDRYLVRLEEIRQSLNILSQIADRIKKGPVWSEDKRVRIPDKDVVFNTMEGLIHHFKFFMTGFDVPQGEAYTPFEGANGELGFYINSKGGPMAHRMRIRGPSVWHFQGLDPMIQGEKIGDLVAALGSINVIAGELDR